MRTEQIATVLIKEAYRKGLVEGAKLFLVAAQAVGPSSDTLDCAAEAVKTYIDCAMKRASDELFLSGVEIRTDVLAVTGREGH